MWAAVAQLVEHVIRNDGVGGSSPLSGTTSPSQIERDQIGRVSQLRNAQLAERFLQMQAEPQVQRNRAYVFSKTMIASPILTP